MQNRFLSFIISFVLLATGACVFYLAYQTWRPYQLLQKQGVMISGSLKSVNATRRTDRYTERTFTIDYANTRQIFVVKPHLWHDYVHQLGEIYRQRTPNAQIEIIYLAQQPHIAMPHAMLSEEKKDIQKLMALGLLLHSLFAIDLWINWRKRNSGSLKTPEL